MSEALKQHKMKSTQYLHSKIHHPKDTVFGMDEKTTSVWMYLQHVDGNAAQVSLINFLRGDDRRIFNFAL